MAKLRNEMRRKTVHEQNVQTAQANTLERERKSGEAYAQKAQSDWNREHPKTQYMINKNTEQKRMKKLRTAQKSTQTEPRQYATQTKPQYVNMDVKKMYETGLKQISDKQFMKQGKKKGRNSQ